MGRPATRSANDLCPLSFAKSGAPSRWFFQRARSQPPPLLCSHAHSPTHANVHCRHSAAAACAQGDGGANHTPPPCLMAREISRVACRAGRRERRLPRRSTSTRSGRMAPANLQRPRPPGPGQAQRQPCPIPPDLRNTPERERRPVRPLMTPSTTFHARRPPSENTEPPALPTNPDAHILALTTRPSPLAFRRLRGPPSQFRIASGHGAGDNHPGSASAFPANPLPRRRGHCPRRQGAQGPRNGAATAGASDAGHERSSAGRRDGHGRLHP